MLSELPLYRWRKSVVPRASMKSAAKVMRFTDFLLTVARKTNSSASSAITVLIGAGARDRTSRSPKSTAQEYLIAPHSEPAWLS
eukprot:766750-Hanusia_phi.AAC.2